MLSSSAIEDARELTMSNTPEATASRKELSVALGAEASKVSGEDHLELHGCLQSITCHLPAKQTQLKQTKQNEQDQNT